MFTFLSFVSFQGYAADDDHIQKPRTIAPFICNFDFVQDDQVRFCFVSFFFRRVFVYLSFTCCRSIFYLVLILAYSAFLFFVDCVCGS